MDETDRVEAERVRRAAETRFEIGFEQSAIGAVITDLDGLPIRVNPALCSLLGRPETSCSAGGGPSTPDPDEVPLGDVMRARLAAGHDTYEDERRYLRPDGSMVWASPHVTLCATRRGEPQYFFTQLRTSPRASRWSRTSPTRPCTTRSPASRTGRCSPTAWFTAWPVHGGVDATRRDLPRRRSTSRWSTTPWVIARGRVAADMPPSRDLRQRSGPETRWRGSAATSSWSSATTSRRPRPKQIARRVLDALEPAVRIAGPRS